MYMSLMPAADHPTVRAIARLIYCNPFLPERVTLEREILGDAVVRQGTCREPIPAAVGHL